MIVPILGHLPQPRLKLFEGLIGSFLRKFIRFLLQINKKRVDVDYFHDLSRTNKTRPSTSPSVMKKAISGSDKHIQRLLSVWMPSMYPECRRHSENELGAERLIELFVFTVKS